MLKSGPGRYGTVPVLIHWITALLIVMLLASGWQADEADDPATKAAFLRFHIPVAILVLLLTAFRIVWWWRFDRKPPPPEGEPAWRAGAARLVHLGFYLVIALMLASGIGLMILSGAAPAVFGSGAALPDFSDYPPRGAHGLGASLLFVLLLFHAGAALFHHFVLRDGMLRRMWFSARAR